VVSRKNSYLIKYLTFIIYGKPGYEIFCLQQQRKIFIAAAAAALTLRKVKKFAAAAEKNHCSSSGSTANQINKQNSKRKLIQMAVYRHLTTKFQRRKTNLYKPSSASQLYAFLFELGVLFSWRF
jgi:hypothetical protein